MKVHNANKKASTGGTKDQPTRLNTGQLIKSYWSFITKNDVAGLEVFLARHGHSVDMDSRLAAAMQATGLHVAVQKNNPAMASVLLEHGVNVNAQNKVGSTALHVACKQGFPDMLRLLIDADADFGLLDASQRAPFEFASWALVVDMIVDPLRQQVAALETSEQESAFREKSRLQDDRRSHLVLTKRTLKQLDDNVRAQRAISNELHAQLEESLSRYRYTIAQADAAKDLLDRQIECVAQMHRVKDEHTAEYNDKLGVVDAMVQCPNDEDVQVWGAYMACCLTAGTLLANQNQTQRILSMQNQKRVFLTG
ncbi:hypothetical protein DYB34_004304 [Aphanomyces astaci]|uniref:Uncharacterized protein n=1 Tax=Aphanomyces astaci TaxID=112090 RepID=A0A3R7B0C0_APHAT|nr:hypothetical protein DYB34_004304 [Aphanomyces astaci]